jgi:hypothetical protein
VVIVSGGHAVHHKGAEPLGLRDWAIFVCKQESLEVDNLFTQLSDCRSKGVILLSEDLNLVLKVSQPLLLPLTTLQSRDTVV